MTMTVGKAYISIMRQAEALNGKITQLPTDAPYDTLLDYDAYVRIEFPEDVTERAEAIKKDLGVSFKTAPKVWLLDESFALTAK